jgi:serine/threonine-protein kinase mTOR
MRLDDRHLDGDAPARPHDQQAHEAFYSVVWSTEDSPNNVGTLNLAENKELWLAKLGSWTEALEVFEEKLSRNPHDFDAILGCMRCLSASGQWSRVLELAEDNWPTLSGITALGQETLPDNPGISQASGFIKTRDQRKSLRMCAEAAWRLGRWDDLEKYSSELVHGQNNTLPTNVATPIGSATFRDSFLPRVDFEGAFFSAVLHIHREEWTMAAEAIDAARKAMDSRFTALMAESYNRAYPSMVTAQTLAEMEEIIEYRKIEKEFHTGANRHPANRPNGNEARERLLSVWRERLAGCRVDAEVHSSILAVRSLVLGPTDEVEATLTLSELSRQAQRFKLAERVLLDPLQALGTDFNGATFGFGLAEALGLRMDLEETVSRNPLSQIIDGLVTDEHGTFLPSYTQIHDQWSKQLIREAGGLER